MKNKNDYIIGYLLNDTFYTNKEDAAKSGKGECKPIYNHLYVEALVICQKKSEEKLAEILKIIIPEYGKPFEPPIEDRKKVKIIAPDWIRV